MRNQPGWPLLAVAGIMIATIALTVFKTPEIDNVLAWVFVGSSLILVGCWAAVEVHRAMLKVEKLIEDDEVEPSEEP